VCGKNTTFTPQNKLFSAKIAVNEVFILSAKESLSLSIKKGSLVLLSFPFNRNVSRSI
jgi:hypothetical protein